LAGIGDEGVAMGHPRRGAFAAGDPEPKSDVNRCCFTMQQDVNRHCATQAGKQARRASKQAGRQASKQASKRACYAMLCYAMLWEILAGFGEVLGSRLASKQAGKQTSKQAGKRACYAAFQHVVARRWLRPVFQCFKSL